MSKGWNSFCLGHTPGANLLIFILLAFSLPAFFQACISQESLATEDSVTSHIRLNYACRMPETRSQSWWLIRRADIFVFNDDAEQSLDSYKRSYEYSAESIRVESGAGEKIVAVIANSHLSDAEIAGINQYEDLTALVTSMAEDSPECPLMSGEMAFSAGEDVSLTLTPLMSEIRISSLKCKMEGGKALKEVKAYLTNVNGRAEMLRTDGFLPIDIINMGRLSESDMLNMSIPNMLYRYLGNGKASSESTDYGGASLFCYPDDAEDETPASPFTTLVIEGKLDGKTNYYPIRINREGYGYSGGRQGIGRNVCYAMNITLTRPGADTPDGNLDTDSAVEQGTLSLHPGNFITARDGERIHIWAEVFPENAEVTIDEEDLRDDKARGIYDYEIDSDGKGVWLSLLRGGSGAFIIEAGPPVNDGALVIVVVNP